MILINGRSICLYVDKSEIDSNVPFLDKRWESTMAIPKIQSCHHFQAYDKEDILVARTSTSLMLRTSVFENNEEEQDETPLNVRKRLKFHDVYSSSEDSDPDEILSAPLPSQIKGRPTKIEKLDVKSGSFFLVKVASDVKKGAPSSIEYKYIAVCQNELDEEGDVKVMFLRSVSQKKNVFKADDDDVAFVKLEQLVCKLPDPDVKPQGNRLYYQFQSAVGVVEK